MSEKSNWYDVWRKNLPNRHLHWMLFIAVIPAVSALILIQAIGPIFPVEPSSSNIAASTRPLVGAIRFDVWNTGCQGFGAGPCVGLDSEKVLGPSKWHYRLPFFGQR